jgi:hypothetical protein
MKSIVKVVIRIFSLYFGLKVILTISNLISYFGVENGLKDKSVYPDYRYYLLFITLYLAIGIVLWTLNDRIADLIIPEEDSAKNLQININYRQLMYITLKIFGIILVISSVEPIFLAITNILDMRINLLYSPQKSYFIILFLEPVIKLTVGSILIFRREKGINE